MQTTEQRLRAITPEWGQRYVAGCLTGSTEDAFGLNCAMNDEQRGLACVVLLHAIPPEAYRAFLAPSWEHSHQQVIAAAPKGLDDLFSYAAFPLNHLPERLKIWRGVSGITPDQAVKGYSWTTDRDVAAWFAMRHSDNNGSPVVVAAEVDRENISFYSEARGEQEVVVLREPASWWIDGNAGDWERGYISYEAAKGNGLPCQ